MPDPGADGPADSNCIVSSPRRLRAAPAEVKISPTRLALFILIRFLNFIKKLRIFNFRKFQIQNTNVVVVDVSVARRIKI